MVDLTEEVEVTREDLKRWFLMKAEVASITIAERLLRTRIFKHYFPTPTEGSAENKHPLNDGTGAILQGDYTINRKVDEGELEALKEAAKVEGSNIPKFAYSKLIRYKPELVKAEYNKLSDDDKAVFDRCLVSTPGTPGMEIKIPKR